MKILPQYYAEGESMKLITIISILSLITSFSFATTEPDQLEYSITEISKSIPDQLSAVGCDNNDIESSYNLLSPVEKTKVSNIISVGKLAYTIIKENKPNLSIRQERASALPEGLSWNQMECWHQPVKRTFQFQAVNGYGTRVIDFVFDVRYTFGGSYKGVGTYLKSVTITPAIVDVLWGYTFDAQVNIPSTVNIGTLEDPMAGMEVQLDWTVSTLLKISRRNLNFFVSGDGNFIEL